MPILARLRSLWRNLLRRTHADAELDDELRAYVELLAEEYERAGMTADDALRRARIETGGVQQVKESTRDAWVGNWFATFAREFRYTVRALRRSPAFVMVAITALALGIGGATAVFTVIKGSLLRPLSAVSDPETLVSLEPIKVESYLYDFSYLDYRDLRAQSRSLAGLAGYDGTPMTLTDRSGVRHSSWVSYVTGNFFSVLGVAPAVGRLIQPADEEHASPVVVLAYDLWQERYGGNPDVVGSTVDLAGQPLTVIGVAPPHFIGAMLMHPMEFWIPITTLPTLVSAPGLRDDRGATYLRLVGRLASDSTIDAAQRDMSLLAAHLAETYPDDEGRGIGVFCGA